jgi:hypothetical protein
MQLTFGAGKGIVMFWFWPSQTVEQDWPIDRFGPNHEVADPPVNSLPILGALEL